MPLGELAALSSAFLWAVGSLIFARLGAEIPAVLLNFWKTTLALVGLMLTLYLSGGHIWPTDFWGLNLFWVAVSGVIGLSMGDSFYFLSLRTLGPRRALVLWAFTPAVTAWIASFVLNEQVTAQFFIGLVVTSVGVLLVMRSRTTGSSSVRPTSWWGIVYGLGAVLCQALGSVSAKLGGASLDGLELSVVRMTFGTSVLVVMALPAGLHKLAPIRRNIGTLTVGSFLGTYLGIWLSMYALQNALTGVVATLQSTSPVFVLPMARWVLDERITLSALAGAGLAVLGVAILVL